MPDQTCRITREAEGDLDIDVIPTACGYGTKPLSTLPRAASYLCVGHLTCTFRPRHRNVYGSRLKFLLRKECISSLLRTTSSTSNF